MASLREQAGLPKGPERRALVLDLLRELPMPIGRLEIGEALADRLGLTEEQRAVREPGQGNTNDRSYYSWMAEWACNDLKHIGVTEQPARALYQLTALGRSISLDEVQRLHRERQRDYRARRKDQSLREDSTEGHDEEDAVNLDWKSELLDRLKSISPTGFEHLAGRLLRKAGFHDVEVTGQSSDGGIDGIGVYRPSGLISFNAAFQCKRYQGSVSASAVRDFRGSFIGRTDRGIIITTGTFTREAQEEAARPGANPVDLIDGETLCELLKENTLGVHTQTVEVVTIDDAYFAQFEDSQ